MDQPPIDNPTADSGRVKDAGKDTQYVLGQLSGTVDNLGRQVAGFDKRLTEKETLDQTRHETQIREQREMGERIFNKIDEVKEISHQTPCMLLSTTRKDIDKVEDKVETVENCVRDIKTTGRVSWRAIVIACIILAFFVGTVIPVILAIWPKK